MRRPIAALVIRDEAGGIIEHAKALEIDETLGEAHAARAADPRFLDLLRRVGFTP